MAIYPLIIIGLLSLVNGKTSQPQCTGVPLPFGKPETSTLTVYNEVSTVTRTVDVVTTVGVKDSCQLMIVCTGVVSVPRTEESDTVRTADNVFVTHVTVTDNVQTEPIVTTLNLVESTTTVVEVITETVTCT
nr:uncharacterized protein LOC123745228 [Procambarus clarkii]